MSEPPLSPLPIYLSNGRDGVDLSGTVSDWQVRRKREWGKLENQCYGGSRPGSGGFSDCVERREGSW